MKRGERLRYDARHWAFEQVKGQKMPETKPREEWIRLLTGFRLRQMDRREWLRWMKEQRSTEGERP